MLIVAAAALLPVSIRSQQPGDALVPSPDFPAPISESGSGSLEAAVWSVFLQVVRAGDVDRSLRVTRELTGLMGSEAELFASFAIDAWVQWEDLVREQTSRACQDRSSNLSPSELLDRILMEQHETDRFRQVAVAEMFERLGATATKTVVDAVYAERAGVMLEADLLLTVLRESPSKYLGRICSRTDPRNLVDTSHLR